MFQEEGLEGNLSRLEQEEEGSKRTDSKKKTETMGSTEELTTWKGLLLIYWVYLGMNLYYLHRKPKSKAIINSKKKDQIYKKGNEIIVPYMVQLLIIRIGVGKHVKMLSPYFQRKKMLMNRFWDFPGGPVVDSCFHCRKSSFHPWLGN